MINNQCLALLALVTRFIYRMKFREVVVLFNMHVNVKGQDSQ